MLGRNGRADGAASARGRMKRVAKLQVLARKSLVAFLTFLLAFGTTPAQLWADGAEGLAQAAEEVAAQSGDAAAKEVEEGADKQADAPSADANGEAPAAPDTESGKSGDASASSEGADKQAPTQEQAPTAESNVAQDEGFDASGADVADSAQVPAENAVDQPAEQATTVKASAQVIGIDAEGESESWAAAPIELPEGSTAADLFKALVEKTGLTANYLLDDDGYFRLDSITSPNDGRVLEYDWMTDANWMLYVDGSAASGSEADTAVTDGAAITWYYTAYGEPLPDLGPSEPDQPDTPEDKTVSASIEVIGTDAQGNPQRWTELSTIELPAKSTAADLSEVLFKQAGITADFGESTWGWSLNTIASPLDGRVLGYDAATGKYWQLFVNGESSSLGASSVELKAGDTISWIYSASGENKPEVGDIVVNPAAPRPNWQPTWNGFGNGGSSAITNVPTPSGSTTQSWATNLMPDGYESQWGTFYVGDPLIVGGYVYACTEAGELVQLDGTTGEVVARKALGGANKYFSRPVYADGLIIMALDDGTLAAYTADALTCVWRTKPLAAPANGESYQALSTLSVIDGKVITGFTDGAGTAGALVCVRISDGAVLWSRASVKADGGANEGYYWAGAAASGSDAVIGDDAGRVQLIDTATGDVKSTVDLGMSCRATIVSAGEEDGYQTYLAVGRSPATLFKIVRDGDILRIAGQVEFGKSSTSTPAIAGGKAFIGGSDVENYGILTVIDIEDMAVVNQVRGERYAPIQSSPLVSVTGAGTFAYYTGNAMPGVVYRYCLETGENVAVYSPSDETQQQYSTASVIADAQGNLYYANDAGYLFCLKGADGYQVTFDTQGGSFVPSALPARGTCMVKPSDPVRPGYSFRGWFVDASGTVAWDFDDPVTSDMTLYAKWVKKDTSAPSQGSGETLTPTPAPGSAPASGNASARIPGGFVPAGKRPIQQVGEKQGNRDGDARAANTAEEEAAISEQGANKGREAARAAARVTKTGLSDRSSAAFLPMALGAAGIVGLIAAGIWLVAGKRGGTDGR